MRESSQGGTDLDGDGDGPDIVMHFAEVLEDCGGFEGDGGAVPTIEGWGARRSAT